MKPTHIHERDINRKLARIVKESIESELPMDIVKATAISDAFNLPSRRTGGMHVNDARSTRLNFEVNAESKVTKVFIG